MKWAPGVLSIFHACVRMRHLLVNDRSRAPRVCLSQPLQLLTLSSYAVDS